MLTQLQLKVWVETKHKGENVTSTGEHVSGSILGIQGVMEGVGRMAM